MTEKQFVWFVFHYNQEREHRLEFEGVFSTEEKARAICKGVGFGIKRMVLDQQLPDCPGEYDPDDDSYFYNALTDAEARWVSKEGGQVFDEQAEYRTPKRGVQ